MREFSRRMNANLSRPEPERSAPAAQQQAAVVQSADEIVKISTEAEHKLSALHPPAAFREVHTARLAFFHSLAATNSAWKQELLHGNAETQNRALKRMGTEGMTARKRIAEAMQRAAPKSAMLRVSGDRAG